MKEVERREVRREGKGSERRRIGRGIEVKRSRIEKKGERIVDMMIDEEGDGKRR